MGEIGTIDEYETKRSAYLRARSDLIASLEPQNPDEMKMALVLAREYMIQELYELVDFRSQRGSEVNTKLYHSSASPAFENLNTGDTVLLVPGKHNKDGLGVGVYFTQSSKAIPFYLKRARRKRSSQDTGGVVFVLDRDGVDGINEFVSFTEKQGPAKHSNSAFVEIAVEGTQIKDSGIKPGDRIKFVYGKARRVPATKKEIKAARRTLCLQSGY